MILTFLHILKFTCDAGISRVYQRYNNYRIKCWKVPAFDPETIWATFVSSLHPLNSPLYRTQCQLRCIIWDSAFQVILPLVFVGSRGKLIHEIRLLLLVKTLQAAFSGLPVQLLILFHRRKLQGSELLDDQLQRSICTGMLCWSTSLLCTPDPLNLWRRLRQAETPPKSPSADYHPAQKTGMQSGWMLSSFPWLFDGLWGRNSRVRQRCVWDVFNNVSMH